MHGLVPRARRLAWVAAPYARIAHNTNRAGPACSNLLLSLGLALLVLLGRLLLLLHQSLHLLHLFDQEGTNDPTYKWLPKRMVLTCL